ncbi:hypothetical protein HYV73_01810 [Candidatus Uhrbacteria bacterium]|nr:hypothetical protein [Candidatus Uhrbacteria bacterium]
MRSLFAGSFFGPEEIESAFTMKDAQGKDVKLIELTPQERQEANRLLKEKLGEPDLNAFLDEMKKTPDELKKNWALTLRVSTIRDEKGNRIPLTMEALHKDARIIAKMKEIDPNQKSVFWFGFDSAKTETFFTQHTPTHSLDPKQQSPSMRWSLTTRALVPETLSAIHTTNGTKIGQNDLLKEFATKKKLNFVLTDRRTPIQITQDVLTRFLKTGERELPNVLDWTDVDSVGFRVFLGRFAPVGLHVNRNAPSNSLRSLGASLSR